KKTAFGSSAENAFEVFPDMPQAFLDYLLVLLGLGQDDRALRDGDQVLGQALGAPARPRGVPGFRLFDVLLEKVGLLLEAGCAHGPNLRVGLRQLLDEGAQQTARDRSRAARHADEEIDETEDAIQRVLLLPKRSRQEHLLPGGEEALGDQLAEILLAFE